MRHCRRQSRKPFFRSLAANDAWGSRSWWQRRFGVICAALFALASVAHALTITAGPSFTPAAAAPLAGQLQITTDIDSRVSVAVSAGTNTWQRHFLEYRKVHALALAGFKPSRTNLITVTVHDRARHALAATNILKFITPALPAGFPTVVLLTNQPARMEPGYTLLRGMSASGSAYVMMLDYAGQVVWYSAVATTLDVRQLPNGNLFIPLATNFTEVNLLGQVVRSWNVPTGWKINYHEGVWTDHGSILYLSDTSRVVTNFPSNSLSNAPVATTNVWYQPVVEMSVSNSALLNLWHPIDILKPQRISYLTFTARSTWGWDWSHANAVIEDPRDDSLIVSMRHQNAVVKFSRATGRLKWILGAPENWGPELQPYLLTPVGTPFQWSYGQHAPVLTPQGTLLLFDNGNYRANPYATVTPDVNNYSRAVEYRIDEQARQVSQVWQFSTNGTDRLFSLGVCNADWLPKRTNVLATFGQVTYVNGRRPNPNALSSTMVRIKEVTHDPVPVVVFDVALFDYKNTNSSYQGCFAYRSRRIPDLYAPQPVQDLKVISDGGRPHLQFSGDASRTYTVEYSSDLQQWTPLGTVTPVSGGYCDYIDTSGHALGGYYRVAIQ